METNCKTWNCKLLLGFKTYTYEFILANVIMFKKFLIIEKNEHILNAHYIT